MLRLAEQSSGYVVAVTHVRNLFAAKTIIEHGDRDRVPVQGGPSTGTLTVVEKVEGAWKMRAADALVFAEPSAHAPGFEARHAIALS